MRHSSSLILLVLTDVLRIQNRIFGHKLHKKMYLGYLQTKVI
jgi:hypothetical protein